MSEVRDEGAASRARVSSTSSSLCLSLNGPCLCVICPPLLCVLFSGETSGTRQRSHFSLAQPPSLIGTVLMQQDHTLQRSTSSETTCFQSSPHSQVPGQCDWRILPPPGKVSIALQKQRLGMYLGWSLARPYGTQAGTTTKAPPSSLSYCKPAACCLAA